MSHSKIPGCSLRFTKSMAAIVQVDALAASAAGPYSAIRLSRISGWLTRYSLVTHIFTGPKKNRILR